MVVLPRPRNDRVGLAAHVAGFARCRGTWGVRVLRCATWAPGNMQQGVGGCPASHLRSGQGLPMMRGCIICLPPYLRVATVGYKVVVMGVGSLCVEA